MNCNFFLNEELLEYYLDLSHQGIRCALLTAANTLPRHPRIKPMLTGLCGVFFSQEIGLSKADPCCYEHVLAELGTNPYNSLFIDDSLSNCRRGVRRIVNSSLSGQYPLSETRKNQHKNNCNRNNLPVCDSPPVERREFAPADIIIHSYEQNKPVIPAERSRANKTSPGCRDVRWCGFIAGSSLVGAAGYDVTGVFLNAGGHLVAGAKKTARMHSRLHCP